MIDNKSTVLVVGGAGFIGSHTALALKDCGITPIIYDNFSRGNRFVGVTLDCPVVDACITDREALAATIRQWRPSAVMHFAARAYVGESVAMPLEYYETNVAGVIAMLDVMRQEGVNQLIFSSTCATYGAPASIPISEETPQAPINPYGRSKLMAEQIICDAQNAFGLQAVIFRYFNASGADPLGRLGECHVPETHLIPLALRAAQHNIPLTIFGNDYPTPDGTCIRDYIHVADIADAHVRGLKHLQAGHKSLTVNLGNGNGYSILDVLNAVHTVTGKEVPHKIGPRRAGDPPILIANAALAHRTLGWQPTVPSLIDMVRTAWNWHATEQGSKGIA